MKINITEKKQVNEIRFDELPIGKAFMSRDGELCIKRNIGQFVSFNKITAHVSVTFGNMLVEPVEIESIDIKIVRGSPSGTNR